ncbi:hypothetical protein BMS3Abin08_00432 [bacterium BMS3Abin08]|nr:hypothetical protein BMS3Abin08_00432 [bacterium BMS3Abin08]
MYLPPEGEFDIVERHHIVGIYHGESNEVVIESYRYELHLLDLVNRDQLQDIGIQVDVHEVCRRHPKLFAKEIKEDFSGDKTPLDQDRTDLTAGLGLSPQRLLELIRCYKTMFDKEFTEFLPGFSVCPPHSTFYHIPSGLSIKKIVPVPFPCLQPEAGTRYRYLPEFHFPECVTILKTHILLF